MSRLDPYILNDKVAKTHNDFMGRTTLVDYPDGDVGSPVLDVTTTYRATPQGHLITHTTQGDQTKEQEFDITERLLRVKDVQGSNIHYNYNPAGDLISVADDTQVMTSIAYDTLGRKTSMTDLNLGTWTYAYDTKGRLVSQTDANNQKINYSYDDLGRITSKSTVAANGIQEKRDTYVYDTGESGYSVKLGELSKVLEYTGTNTAVGQEVRITLFGYDPVFRRTNKVTRHIVGVGKFTQTMANDVKGRVTSTLYPGGKSVFYKYNVAGGLMQTCDKSDCSGEVYHRIDPASGYDVYGAIQKETYGNGVTSDYVYYPNSHRLMERTVALGDTVHSKRAYTFDGFTNMTKLDDPLNKTGSAAWSIVHYDNLNRLTSYQSKQTGKVESFEYDKSGNMLKNTAFHGDKVYQYDPSRPHAVTQIGEGPDAETFTYDANGNMLTDKSRTMVYSAQNQLKKVTMKNNVVVEYDYDYTGARVLKKATKKDPLNRITVTNTHFLGEALEVRGEQVHLHVNVGSQRVATHGMGKLSELQGIGAGTLRQTNFTPDVHLAVMMPWLMLMAVIFVLASLRPTRSVIPAVVSWNPASFIIQVSYAWSRYTLSLHEALHSFHLNRFAKTVSAILIFVMTSLFPMVHVAMAGDTGTPINPIDDEQYLVYYHGDHLGSTHIISEGKDNGLHSGITYPKGTLLQRIEYTPFGKELYVLNSNLKFDPRYTGQEYDIETGLYYYKARYYNPTLGRFIQADTIVPDAKNLQAFNRYAYAANNPLKYTDPSGHGFWGWFRKIFAMVAGLVASVLTMGALAPAAYSLSGALLVTTISGVAGGVVGGAISGGARGAAMGAMLAFLSGIVGGALTYGLTAVVGQSLANAIMKGIGYGISYATGGWKGMLQYQIAQFGAAVVMAGISAVAGALQGGNKPAIGGGSARDAKKLEEIIMADMASELESAYTGPPTRSTGPQISNKRNGYGWFRGKSHDYVVGRKGEVVAPGRGIGKFLDDYMPASHTAGVKHDMLVERLVDMGFPDKLVNIPTMPGTYFQAVFEELVNSVSIGHIIGDENLVPFRHAD